MKKYLSIALLTLLLSVQVLNILAVQRFPKPEFEKKYTQPVMQTPSPRSVFMEYFDV
jgi:hypothetical protein